MTNYFKNKTLKKFSESPLKAAKPQNNSKFGYWLAGLIDSDGHITNPRGYVQIAFHSNDLSVAHYVKHVIGYGKITIEKKSFVVRYRCTSLAGLKVISDLVRHKLKHAVKINQYNNHLSAKLMNKGYQCELTKPCTKPLNQNNWLAGFIQGDGSLGVLLSKRKTRNSYELRMDVAISQKSSDLLLLIKHAFGGSIGLRKAHDTYYYTSNSFTHAAKFITYLDKYQLIGNKFKQYKLWRCAYLLFQNNEHLTPKGLAQFNLLKLSLSFLRQKRLKGEPNIPRNVGLCRLEKAYWACLKLEQKP